MHHSLKRSQVALYFALNFAFHERMDDHRSSSTMSRDHDVINGSAIPRES